MKWMGAFFGLFLLCGAPASADPIEQAFVSGRFLQSAEMAELEGGADNFARAARAILADAIIQGEPTDSRLDDAEALARKALSLDPEHVEGRLQLAITLSLKARRMSTREALDSGYGGASRDLVKDVLEAHPDNVYAQGFMAVWNIEVVRRGGGLGAAFMGASVHKAREHYTRAIETGEADPALHWQYARALAALNARKYEDEIATCLDRAISGQADDTLTRIMQARAQSFRHYVDGHTREDIEKAAAALL